MSESRSSSVDAPGRIPITVNGEAITVPQRCSIVGLLEILDLGDRKVAVARNRSVVPRTRHQASMLDAGDRIEILEAVGGG